MQNAWREVACGGTLAENADIVTALDAAIGSKADKEYVDGRINVLQNSINNITNSINVDSIDNEFIITDANGNIGLKLDESGLLVKDVTAKIDNDTYVSLTEVSKKLDQSTFNDVITNNNCGKFMIITE